MYSFFKHALRRLFAPRFLALGGCAFTLAFAGTGLPLRGEVDVLTLRVGEVGGVAMLRGEAGRGVSVLRAGEELPAGGAAVVTGADSRVELTAADGGMWRVGSLALWIPSATGGRLLAGTVLVDVPDGTARAIDSTTGRMMLGGGLWIVQATHNEGLKLICLDGPAEATAAGGVESAGDHPARVTLRPGELVFLRPGGLEFGPVVTVFLQELLATSRLLNGFSEPAPRADRLRWLAQAQTERLKRVTNAFVAGARDEEGFQLVVPRGEPERRRDR